MTIRNVLVHIEGGASGAKRMEACTAFAREHGARLTGLYVNEPVVPAMVTTTPGIPPGSQPRSHEMRDQLERLQAESRARAKACEQRFLQVARSADTEAEWTCVTGDPLDALARHALYADLLVVGQGGASSHGPSGDGLSGRLVLRIACPLLVMPGDDTTRSFGERILVAWNVDVRAQRAVQAALPLLKRADRVEVVTVGERTSGVIEGPLPGREIRKYLAHHAVPIEYNAVGRSGRSVGETLLARADLTGSDLIVMGAYHHSRLREALLGGVTRHVLRNAALPVLVAH